MQEFTVLNGPLTIPAGMVIKLTKEQAESRLHNLITLKDGLYRVEKAIQFKTGEKITFKTEPTKQMLPAIYHQEELAEVIAERKAKGQEGKNKSTGKPATNTGKGKTEGEPKNQSANTERQKNTQ